MPQISQNQDIRDNKMLKTGIYIKISTLMIELNNLSMKL